MSEGEQPPLQTLLQRTSHSYQHGTDQLFHELLETLVIKAHVPANRIGAVTMGNALIDTDADVAQLQEGDELRVRLKCYGEGDEEQQHRVYKRSRTAAHAQSSASVDTSSQPCLRTPAANRDARFARTHSISKHERSSKAMER